MTKKKDVTAVEGVRVGERETEKALPKTLPGAVCWQWVRCGKPGCKCERGELHGPYAYRFERVNGRLRKHYIPKADVAAFITACERHREERKVRRAAHRELTELLRGYTATCREVERWVKTARSFR